MPWPTQATTQNDALGGVDRAAARLKKYCRELRLDAEAGDVAADRVSEELVGNLLGARAVFAAAATVPNIAAYVAQLRGTTEQAITTAFNDMVAAVDAALAWLAANLPKDVDGWLLVRKLDAQGQRTSRLFSPAETAGLRVVLQAVEAAID